MSTLTNSQATGDCPPKLTKNEHLDLEASQAGLPESDSESAPSSPREQRQPTIKLNNVVLLQSVSRVEKKTRRSGSKIPGRKNVPLAVNNLDESNVLGELKSPSEMKKKWNMSKKISRNNVIPLDSPRSSPKKTSSGKNPLATSEQDILDTRADDSTSSWNANTTVVRNEQTSIFREASSGTGTPILKKKGANQVKHNRSVSLKSPKSGTIHRTPNKRGPSSIQVGLHPNADGLGTFSVPTMIIPTELDCSIANIDERNDTLNASLAEEPSSPRDGESVLAPEDALLKLKSRDRLRAQIFGCQREIRKLRALLNRAQDEKQAFNEMCEHKLELLEDTLQDQLRLNETVNSEYKTFQNTTFTKEKKKEEIIAAGKQELSKTRFLLKDSKKYSWFYAILSVVLIIIFLGWTYYQHGVMIEYRQFYEEYKDTVAVSVVEKWKNLFAARESSAQKNAIAESLPVNSATEL